MTPFPEIKTKRLLLRQIQDSDLENIFRGLSHPDVIKYCGVNFNSRESTKEQMTWYRDLLKNETGIWWAICSQDNTVFYGATGFNNLQKEHKKAEIGFWLLPEFWSRGYVSEAVNAIMDYAFNSMDLHRIEAYVEVGNENSAKALKKLSF
ncbi:MULTISPECIES: GNAT family N-acetyltransferase [Antarcticibacterium]|uniref:GNAT family N-acetyltransferase n=1 Tax=Antarcticibacterium TaxID=2058174 RepID=UPI0026A513F6|nr:GNAT family N-acetyltransferase [Antarcticibacterium flavum]